MPPAPITIPIRFPSLSKTGPQSFRVQGWDPILIISQIVCLQCWHYLSLSLLLPPLLAMFATPAMLTYEGGPTSISLIMDWREFNGFSTVSIPAPRGIDGGWIGLNRAFDNDPKVGTSDWIRDVVGNMTTTSKALLSRAGEGKTADFWATGAWRRVGENAALIGEGEVRQGLLRIVQNDAVRGWVVALSWCAASFADVFFLYHFVRRPTHILDFSCTLIFNHLILTTYYSASFPTSLFYWVILTMSTVVQIVVAEQWCVRRDMKEGFSMANGATPSPGHASDLERSTKTHSGDAGAGRRSDDVPLLARDELELASLSSSQPGHARGASGASVRSVGTNPDARASGAASGPSTPTPGHTKSNSGSKGSFGGASGLGRSRGPEWDRVPTMKEEAEPEEDAVASRDSRRKSQLMS